MDTFISPVAQPSRITAPYGVRYLYGKHKGVDLINTDSPRNRVVYAPQSGVVSVYKTLGKGNIVEISNGKYRTQIAHMQHIEVEDMSYVHVGDLLGEYGSTGIFTTGKHIHWELREEGDLVDPMKYIGQPFNYSDELMTTFQDGIKDLYWDVLGRGIREDEYDALLSTDQTRDVYETQRRVLLESEERRMAIAQAYERVVERSATAKHAQEYIDFQISHATPFARLYGDLLQNKKDLQKKNRTKLNK